MAEQQTTPDDMSDDDIAARAEAERLAKWKRGKAKNFKYGPFVVFQSNHVQFDPETGKDRMYNSSSGPFMSDKDLLLLNGPGMSPKFGVHGVSSVGADPNVTIRPGESVKDFAARVAAFAASAAPATSTTPADTKGLFQEDREAAEKAKAQRDASLQTKIAGLNALSVEDLRSLAAAEEIELHGASKKEDVVKVVRAALSSRVGK